MTEFLKFSAALVEGALIFAATVFAIIGTVMGLIWGLGKLGEQFLD